MSLRLSASQAYCLSYDANSGLSNLLWIVEQNLSTVLRWPSCNYYHTLIPKSGVKQPPHGSQKALTRYILVYFIFTDCSGRQFTRVITPDFILLSLNIKYNFLFAILCYSVLLLFVANSIHKLNCCNDTALNSHQSSSSLLWLSETGTDPPAATEWISFRSTVVVLVTSQSHSNPVIVCHCL